MTPILRVEPLGFPWQTADPFLFCVHHDDAFPAGNAQLGPAASLTGRQIGQDFANKDGWNMYHGQVVPGFPGHPHRGFETVTVVRRGLIDHSDSLGATARFGGGDTQWLTAGKGIVHAEMFPLVSPTEPNPAELFQIWLNLPQKSKMVEPHFSMLWASQIPHLSLADEQGRKTEITVIAGRFGSATPPAPPPRSWASEPDADVAIWTLKLDPGARVNLPQGQKGSNRALYFFAGSTVKIAGQTIERKHVVFVDATAELEIENGPDRAELLLLQGRPIGEAVARYGPFVMNTQQEIQTAFADFQRTRFGGWPFDRNDPVHPREQKRFARHADGRVEEPQ